MTEPLWEDDRPRPAAHGPVKVRVPAKINLHLGVGDIREDGFHEVATVYHAIALHDEITVRSADSLALTMDGEGAGELALDHSNLVIRAVHMLAAATGREAHARIHLRKQIPLAAGLGSDVPFLVLGGTALGTGRGETVSPAPAPGSPSRPGRCRARCRRARGRERPSRGRPRSRPDPPG